MSQSSEVRLQKKREHMRAYYKRPEIAARRRLERAQHYLEHREEVCRKVAKWRQANPAKAKATARKYYLKQKADPAKWARKKAYWAQWHRDNRTLQLAKARGRRGYPNPTRPCPAVCECCGKAPTDKMLALDHCHRTGQFRGWLCTSCNLGIGKLGDSIKGLQNALAYLRRAKQS